MNEEEKELEIKRLEKLVDDWIEIITTTRIIIADAMAELPNNYAEAHED
jgi:hypothetical protein